jgi:hypothetical protein
MFVCIGLNMFCVNVTVVLLFLAVWSVDVSVVLLVSFLLLWKVEGFFQFASPTYC